MKEHQTCPGPAAEMVFSCAECLLMQLGGRVCRLVVKTSNLLSVQYNEGTSCAANACFPVVVGWLYGISCAERDGRPT